MIGLMFFSFTTFFSSVEVVQAGYDDPYYFETFNNILGGKRWINITDNGVTWMRINPNTETGYPQVDTREGYKGYCITTNGVGDRNAWSNHSGIVNEFYLHNKIGTSNDGQFVYNVSFYDNSNLVFYVNFVDDQVASSQRDVFVYYSDFTLLASDVASDNIYPEFNFTFHTGNGTSQLEIGNTSIKGWFDINCTNGIRNVKYSTSTTDNLRYWVFKHIKLAYGDSSPPQDLYVYIIPYQSKYYTGSTIRVRTYVDESYEGQFLLRIRDASDPRVTTHIRYVQKGTQSTWNIDLKSQDVFGNSYTMGEWICELADFDVYWESEYMATHLFNVDLGDTPSINTEFDEYNIGDNVKYFVTNGNESETYNVKLNTFTGQTIYSWNIKTNAVGEYEGLLLDMDFGTYILNLYSNTSEWLNESNVFFVRNDSTTQGEYTIYCNEQYFSNSQINFEIKNKKNNIYTVEIYNADEHISFVEDGVGDKSFIYNHNRTHHGIGTFTIYVFDKDGHHGDANAKYKSFRVILRSSDDTDEFGGLTISEWKNLIGIFIVMFFVLIPVGIRAKTHVNTNDHGAMSAFFGLVGLSIAILFDFLPVWFAFVFGFVAIAVIIYTVIKRS